MLIKTSIIFSKRCFKGFSFWRQCVTAKFSDKCLERYKVRILPALSDNYMYILGDSLLRSAIAIDPVEPDKVLKCLESENLELKAVVTTHHHLDHSGGNKAISQMVENLPIYGFDERIQALTNRVSHNESITIEDLVIKCLHTPCHTTGHICYFIDGNTAMDPICFSGDTLFVGGCGRFFEGSAKDMLESLNILSALPPKTRVYCGHEYTLSNLKFALSVEPNNSAALQKLKDVEKKLQMSEPSVPSTIGEEMSYNPFLRTDKVSIQQKVQLVDSADVMASLRKLKDAF